ncbi:interleukin-12 subunit alpha [Paramisgurnus dabryanus]|uniref:interleukin-12 subunit alpha n=1 Tax=Paramisgurnus dabryanus TaxID=90735 RepID=UPI0031F39C48
MQPFSFFAVTVLCCALSQCAIAGPVGVRDLSLRLKATECKEVARSLLSVVSGALAMDHLFVGFNCTQQNAEVHVRTKTMSACTSHSADCLHSSVLNIDENECLQRILEDLHYYWETFTVYANSDLSKTVVRSIDDVMQNCFAVSAMDNSELRVSMDHPKSFQERLQLCKVLKGFHLRAITINRVFNYILAK